MLMIAAPPSVAANGRLSDSEAGDLRMEVPTGT